MSDIENISISKMQFRKKKKQLLLSCKEIIKLARASMKTIKRLTVEDYNKFAKDNNYPFYLSIIKKWRANNEENKNTN